MVDENLKSDQIPSQPATTDPALVEAAELMSATVLNLRRQWPQSAISAANRLRGGQAVSRGAFDDLKRLRGNYEELERARGVLLKLTPAENAEPDTAQNTNRFAGL